MPQALKTLLLFKRHAPDCDVHKSRIPKKNHRFWFDCQCQIYVTGQTPDGQFVSRQSTGYSDLRKAEAFRDSLLDRYQAKGDAVSGPTVAECIEKHLASHASEVGERTLNQHRLHLERLRQFMTREGVFHIRAVTVDHLETFKTAGLPKDLKSTTRATIDAKVRCFLRAAYRRGWIKEAMVEKTTTVRAVYDQEDPYTEKEVEAILNGALDMDGGTHGYARRPATFRLLIELMLETGMRVGDAVSFNPRRLVKGESLWIYTFMPMKQKRTERPKPTEVFLTDALKKRIDECEWMSEKGPFWYGTGTDPNSLAQAVYERMQSIGGKAAISGCRPHRLRHTFAVRKLLAGIQLEDVSRLLGHSSVKVTEAHYAKWVAARKTRLERLVAQTLVDPVRDGSGD